MIMIAALMEPVQTLTLVNLIIAQMRNVVPARTITVQNVSVMNSNVVGGAGGGTNGGTGGVVGELWNIGVMNYCSYTGEVSGTGFDVGGLVGSSSKTTTVYRCATSVDVEQDGWGSRVGGLIGHAQGDVEECCSFGDVDNLSAVEALSTLLLNSVTKASNKRSA